MQALREQSAEDLRRFVEPFLGRGVALASEVWEGEPWRAILEGAATVSADLVVMGTHGRTGFEHLLLGSVTEKVLRRAGCPVLTVGSSLHLPAPGLFRRILCAVDLSGSSRRTIDTALAFADESDALVTMLHVVSDASTPAVPGLFGHVQSLDARRREVEEEALARLRREIAPEDREWRQVREVAATGTPWREILAVADERKADLVVMGAHGHGPLGERLFGSTASHVVRRSACPVLVVRPVEARTGSATGRSREEEVPRAPERVVS
jgi:nucleotide-binding universal stress UspA family protein